ncbi:hypothetical protein EV379_3440 [Microterricola gilva]|uniref:Uncharacterized protein n=1 Tax=Microterricola gilva TaxID=393267 RepID=A0A4Q8AQT1_9MICO|nr:hypothetical protein EV379_3440 [Microterricola gilva]
MLGFRVNRALQPFNVATAILAIGVGGSILTMAANDEITATTAILLIVGALALCYLLRVLTYLLSPYQLRISEDRVSFPAHVTPETYRWWRALLPSASVRYFASQQFEGTLSRAGFSGRLRFPSTEMTIVEFSHQDIVAVDIQARGLSVLEVTVRRRHGSEPFVCRVQTGVWPVSGRDRAADALRKLSH